MQDAAHKRVFRHAGAVKRLVRVYAPDRAGEIDFSTLARMGTELVGQALTKRYPDALWIVRKRGGAGHMVILLEFQATRDPLMGLRMAIYQLLIVQEFLERARPSPKPDTIEVLSFVFYHGAGKWAAVPSLRELFRGWVPGDHRVIPPGDGAQIDLAEAVIALERDHGVDATLANLEVLRQIAEESGADYDHFLTGCVGDMLVSTGRITREQLREVRTMAQVSTAYQQSLEEYGRKRFRPKWFRQGRDEGIRQERLEQARILCQRARKKFGADAADELAALLGDNSEPGRLLDVAAAVGSCTTADELLRHVRSTPSD